MPWLVCLLWGVNAALYLAVVQLYCSCIHCTVCLALCLRIMCWNRRRFIVTAASPFYENAEHLPHFTPPAEQWSVKEKNKYGYLLARWLSSLSVMCCGTCTQTATCLINCALPVIFDHYFPFIWALPGCGNSESFWNNTTFPRLVLKYLITFLTVFATDAAGYAAHAEQLKMPWPVFSLLCMAI